MDKDELERTKNVHKILRLTTLLHKRILMDLLSSSSSVPSNVALDALLVQSGALLAASDDLVSTLYVPQNSQTVHEELQSFLDVVKALQTGLQAFFPAAEDLEKQFSKVTIQGVGVTQGSTEQTGDKVKTNKKWFDTCFDQIYKLGATFENALKQNIADSVRGS
ncbi:hypothetical protein SERLADRAFT_403792 [Serpula lacrymans var. lacrymans S7.9]|nr:uncharacterized protein SERLADRAFT_403792 [Serpula lacrymans var. lacrymans S7.9]EGO18565.1 hypothetical protein SERLADRAFT_403792 [Serpula lacrymans var. lacrymans S7.9]